jgi:hypothetical protein
MTVESPDLINLNLMSKQRTRSYQPRRTQSMAEMKARQSAKIREIAEALASAGFVALDAQAKALGIGRSTAWTILKSSHKGSGLSPKIINRILANDRLPALVRAKMFEYVKDKASGRYGHSAKLRQKFITALSAKPVKQRAEARNHKAASGASSGHVASLTRRHATVNNSDPVDLDHKPLRSRRAV